MKKTLSAIVAVVLCLGMMTACGDSESSKKANTPESQAVQSQSEPAVDSSASVSSSMPVDQSLPEPVNSQAEAPTDDSSQPEDDSQHYEYYKELAAAYASSPKVREYHPAINGTLHTDRIRSNQSAVLSDDEKKVIFCISTAEGSFLYIYNIDSKEIKKIDLNKEYNVMSLFYRNGYIYVNYEDYIWKYSGGDNIWDYKIKIDYCEKYDENGKLVKNAFDNTQWQIKTEPYIFADDHIFCKAYNTENDEECWAIFSNDLKNCVPVPPIEYEVSHGLTEKNTPEFFMCTEKGLFTYESGATYFLETNANEWKKIEDIKFIVGTKAANKAILAGDYFIYYQDATAEGKSKYEKQNYLYQISNIATGELITDKGSKFYLGDQFNYELKSEGNQTGWFKIQYPDKDGTDIKQEFVSKEEAKVNRIISLNNKYYLVYDKYGLFLRTYEKGEAEEDQVMLF